ncbi:ABC transporter ATP-binding protein [Candidatus Bipolaricaulota bacterium]|nr:ABC transporter ATP-binding protein [Candidatus Bipolaricaulota bacterium]
MLNQGGERRKMEWAIRAEGLTKAYRDLVAVDHISFQVQEGELFGLLGPNGAGKTTTIRILTGLSRPSAGKASVLGHRVPSEIVQVKRKIGVVPEQSNIYEELTVIENLLFMGRLYGVPRRKRLRRAEELVETFRLAQRKKSPARSLSRGMKRALTLACALMHNPRLLFLDEPTVGLDVAAARALRDLIQGLHRQGVTVFLTTHYLEEADLLCERVAILVRGRIAATGSPAELKKAAQGEPVIEVRLEKPVARFQNSLSSRLPGALTFAPNPGVLRIVGGDPAQALEALFASARETGARIVAVNTLQPTLEEAFLKITGLSPTTMDREKPR